MQNHAPVACTAKKEILENKIQKLAFSLLFVPVSV
jgi:hypothetical protein